MIAYQVTSLNRYQMVEITHHYTPKLAESEMVRRVRSGHSAIQSRQVNLQPKPGKGKGAGR